MALQEAAQQEEPEVALCLLRVTFTTDPWSPTPISAALTEDLILGLLLRRQSHASSATGASFTRQGSYTEMQLGAPVPQVEVSFAELLQCISACN